jgi:alkylresorcinol/alkylpyrone synthase
MAPAEPALGRGMTNIRIAAVATASPATRFTQDEVLAVFGYDDPQRRGFFERSEIDGRFMYVDRERARADESIDELHARFRAGALELGEAAMRRALDQAGWAPSDLDFVATTTCTGRLTPSLDAHLVGRLGCRPDVQRVHVGDTGCASAMVAMQQAWNHLRAFPSHRALVLAVEICSTTYFLDDRLESAVAHAIFADGAAALALDTTPGGPRIVTHRTLFRSEHLDAMGFEYPGGRHRIVLSKDVRRIGPKMFGEMAAILMDSQGLKPSDVRYWVLHSAGRRVLDRAGQLLALSEEQVAHARHVLRTFGNMSSATILFVLAETLRKESPAVGDWGLMIGLGPGFAAEGALLSW